MLASLHNAKLTCVSKLAPIIPEELKIFPVHFIPANETPALCKISGTNPLFLLISCAVESYK